MNWRTRVLFSMSLCLFPSPDRHTRLAGVIQLELDRMVSTCSVEQCFDLSRLSDTNFEQQKARGPQESKRFLDHPLVYRDAIRAAVEGFAWLVRQELSAILRQAACRYVRRIADD